MFAFYDLETSGTSSAFDQPLQFAGILTTAYLEEVERINIRCQLSKHILPAPWALAVTKITPDILYDPNLPTAFEFSQEIGDIIDRWGPATWVGFNSIAFDEQMLRQMFYQNLYPNIYKTQSSGNNRLDVMKLVYATWVLANNALNWPVNDDGKISFKLDQLAPANGFVSDNFHDALADVEATIHIAKLISERAPSVWAQTLRNRSKYAILDLLESGRVLTLIERYGATAPRSYSGVYAGRNPDNQNSIAFLDLELTDPGSIDPNDAEAVAKAVSGSPKLVRTISINNAPNIFDIHIDDPLLKERASEIQDMQDLKNAFGNALAGRYVDEPEPEEVEQQIFGSFYSDGDRLKLRQFQQVSWEDRIEIAQTFDDARLKWLASRLLYLNRRDLLSQSAQNFWEQQLSDRWLNSDPKSKWTTFAKISEQMSEIFEQGILADDQMETLAQFYKSLEISVS